MVCKELVVGPLVVKSNNFVVWILLNESLEGTEVWSYYVLKNSLLLYVYDVISVLIIVFSHFSCVR